MNDSWELRVRLLLLSIQRALLGEITPNIRAVTAQIDSDTITLRWIIDGEISDGLRDDLSAVGAAVVADFATHQIAEEFIRCDASHAMDELYLDVLRAQRVAASCRQADLRSTCVAHFSFVIPSLAMTVE